MNVKDNQTGSIPNKRISAGEALSLKLLQSVREMKAGQAARITKIELNEVVQARHSTGLSQAQFTEPLSVSKRTLQAVGTRSPFSIGSGTDVDSYCQESSGDSS